MKAYLVVVVLSVACLTAALLAGYVFEVQPSTFYRDPAATLNGRFSVGWFSNLGAVCWFGAAAVLLFTASIAAEAERTPLLALGTFTLLLGADDLFLVHEGVLPFLGLPGELLYLAYGMAAAAWLILCRSEIARTRWGLLVAGIGLLGLSVAIDLAYDLAGLQGEGVFLAEDVAKFAGILFWGIYCVEYAWMAALRIMGPVGGA